MKQSVVDQAFLHCPEDSLLMFCFGDAGCFDFNAEFSDARWVGGLLGAHPNRQTIGWKILKTEVLCRVVAGASTKRCQKEFRWGHARIFAAVGFWLVAQKPMATGVHFKLRPAKMLNEDFHLLLIASPPEMRGAGRGDKNVTGMADADFRPEDRNRSGRCNFPTASASWQASVFLRRQIGSVHEEGN